MSKNLITPACIISYAQVHEPREVTYENDDGTQRKVREYSAQLLFNKKKQLGPLKKLKLDVQKFGKEKLGTTKFKMPFRDGSKELEEGDQDDPFYEGKIFFNVRAQRKPGIVGMDNEPLEDPMEELYSGCICKVSLRPFAWSGKKGGKGVSLGLVNIKKLADGPRLDGSISAEDEFADDESDDEDLPFETVEVDRESEEDEDDLFD